MTSQTENGAARFAHIKGVLLSGGSAQVGLKTRYVGAADAGRFARDYANDLTALHYAQCRVYEPKTKYVIRTRLGAN